jgi:acetylornithine deacetylase
VLDSVALDAAIARGAERAFTFLERLVAAPSTVGREAGALEVFATELRSLGFTIRKVPLDPRLGDDPRAGVVQQVPGPRYDVVGTLGPQSGRSLLLNGHIDVVPARTPERWSSPPFAPRRDGQLLYGRGAGDMKGGFAMGVLALRALLEVHPQFLTGPLSFLAAIEEECTGNGTLSAAIDGVLADAVVLLEPTDLDLLVGGIGILWCDIEVDGVSTHAEAAHQAINPVDLLTRLTAGLREWATGLAERFPDPALADAVSPYNLNLGEIWAGDWPSSVPTTATMRLRIGFPRAWTPDQAERAVRAEVTRIAEADGAFPSAPRVRLSGFRAAGYWLDPAHPLVRSMAVAHAEAHGGEPAAYSLGSTTDARIYLNDFDVPALCYGPIAHNIHGVDESVDLDSIVAGARTLARFLHSYYAPGGQVRP